MRDYRVIANCEGLFKSSVPAVAAPNSSNPLVRWLPAIGWLRDYDRGRLRLDVIAGITLAAYLLPAGIGDASLANLPPEAGLYACLFSGLVFWLFCSSRHTAITVTSAISLLLGATLGEIAGGDTSRFVALAGATAILVSLIAFVAWLVRAGAIVSFVSETVLIGFKAGVALYLGQHAAAQAIRVSRRAWGFLGDERPFPAASARNESRVAGPGARCAGRARAGQGAPWKNRPIALLVVIGGIAAATLWDLGAHGVKLLGTIPQGLPDLGLPRR